MSSIITVKNLNLWYGTNHALKNINMNIRLWEIHFFKNAQPNERFSGRL